MAALQSCAFAVVADCQYSDLDNTNVEGRTQRYREAPGKLREAVSVIKDLRQKRDLKFFVHVGDFIQGRPTYNETMQDLEEVASICDQLSPLPVYHVIGNHDLACPRRDFIARCQLPSSYYSVTVAPGWRLLVLDTTELGISSGYAEDSDEMKESRAFLAAHPLSDQHPQMESWNSGCASTQISWLKSELSKAESAGEKVVVAGHHPIGQGSARATHMAWNWDTIQDILAASPAVVLVLTGHDHEGGYAAINGKHFVTLEAMLEAPTGGNAFAIIEVGPEGVTIEGHGTVTTRQLPLPK